MAELDVVSILKNFFEKYSFLRNELYTLCEKYANNKILPLSDEDYNILEYHEFSDFLILEDDKIGLMFLDEQGDPCITYKTVTIEDLSDFYLNYDFKR